MISQDQFRMMEMRLASKSKRLDKPPQDAIESGEESKLHDAIIQDLRSRRWLYHHDRFGVKTTGEPPGRPDFLVFPPEGAVIMIEVKTRTGKLSHEQLGYSVFAKMLGYRYEVVRSMSEYLKVINV